MDATLTDLCVAIVAAYACWNSGVANGRIDAVSERVQLHDGVLNPANAKSGEAEG